MAIIIDDANVDYGHAVKGARVCKVGLAQRLSSVEFITIHYTTIKKQERQEVQGKCNIINSLTKNTKRRR